MDFHQRRLGHEHAGFKNHVAVKIIDYGSGAPDLDYCNATVRPFRVLNVLAKAGQIGRLGGPLNSKAKGSTLQDRACSRRTGLRG